MKKIVSLAVCFAFLFVAYLQAEETSGVIEHKHTGAIWSSALSPDGKIIVTGSRDRTARVWDTETGKELQKLEGHKSTVGAVAFSPDGKKLVTADRGSNLTGGNFHIWDVPSWQKLREFDGHKMQVMSVVFSPDGKKIATASRDKTARIGDVESGKELHKLEEHTANINSVTFSPDGKKIATAGGDGTARIWDVDSGKELQVLEKHEMMQRVGMGAMRWQLLPADVRSAVFSPDGTKVVTASADGTARIWDVDTGKELHKLEMYLTDDIGLRFDLLVSSAVFSPDGRDVVTASADNIIRIWDVESGEEQQRFEGHTVWVLKAKFSSDGQKIISWGHDKTARIWEVSSGKELRCLAGHTDYVRSAEFSPDEKKVFTTSNDGTTRIWNLERLPPPRVPPAVMDF
jgi:WD40 repeat protein